MSRRGVFAVVILDLLVLLELSVAIYLANGNQETFTVVFLKTFFALLIPTFLLWRYAFRRFCAQKPEPGQEEMAP